MKNNTLFALVLMAFSFCSMRFTSTYHAPKCAVQTSTPVKVTKEGNTYSFAHSASEYSYLIKRFEWLLTTDNFKLVTSFEITATSFSVTFAESADEKYIKEKLLIFAEPLGFNEIQLNF
jgi:hypothetical protein